MPFDPFRPWGPLLKFIATIWMILIPYLFIKLKDKQFTGETFFRKQNSIIGMTLAWVVRCAVMFVADYLVLVYIYQAPLNYIDLSWMGLGGINGIMAVFITVVILNTLQGFFDAAIPYFLIFRGKIYSLYHFF